MSVLSVQLLGGVAVESDQRELIRLRSGKSQALFAYLVTEGRRVHSRDTLAGLLWPDVTPKASALSLRQALHRLKTRLPTDALTITRKSVEINAAVATVSDFQIVSQAVEMTRAHDHDVRYRCSTCRPQLEKIVELYGGEFLDGLFLDDCTTMEEWILFTREWVKRNVLAALDDLTRHHLEARTYRQAETYAQQLLQIDPLQETTHRQLMEIFAATGRRADALKQFERCRLLLEKEFGVSPAPETMAFMRELKNDGETVTGAPLPSANTAFFGRSAEFTQLSDWINQPHIRLITIVGTGGVGKTRLALRVAEETELPHGVAFIPLANIPADAALLLHLLSATAAALGIKPSSGAVSEQEIIDYLRARKMLLIYDNLEHLALNELRDFIRSLLINCLHITILQTSRERLRLPSEQLLKLDGLPVPTSQADNAHEFASIQLFEESARRVVPNFRLTASNKQAVIDIC